MKSKYHPTRRDVLIGGATLAGAAVFWHYAPSYFPAQEVPGEIVGGSSSLGHRLRDATPFPEPTETLTHKIVIVGGGIAGLSAAWKLQKSGIDDFLLFELEKDVGGTATCGSNAASSYPWAAHYVPLLTEEATATHELFADLGIIEGYRNGKPVYNEYYLCAEPQERLYMLGRWQEGLVPQLDVTPDDRIQYAAFFARMAMYKQMKGSDGKRAFAIPIAKSSSDHALRKLDTISMADFMASNGWNSVPLNWYVNYCCRDDYGTTMDQVSAWAGIHYFASRNGTAANADPQTVVTWPEGNGWIVRQLRQRFPDKIKTHSMVYSIKHTGSGAQVLTFDPVRNVTTKIHAKAVIAAIPQFIASRIIEGYSQPIASFTYAPWMVANITLDAMPEGRGMPLCWDNVVYDSQLLGYVDATHQALKQTREKTVLTYYWPLSHTSPAQARNEAITRSFKEWRDAILHELYKIHPELYGHVTRLDVWVWGHGMIRPTPGFIWGDARRRAQAAKPPVWCAHTDLSGIAIFEEAQHHGIIASESAMKHLGHNFQTSL